MASTRVSDVQREEFSHQIESLYRWFGEWRTRPLVLHGFSESDYASLTVVGRNPGITVGKLTAELHISDAKGSRRVKRLADKGWLSLAKSNQDQRQTKLQLTEAGSRLLSHCEEFRRHYQDRLLRRLPAKRRKEILAAITELNDTKEQIAEDLYDSLASLEGAKFSPDGKKRRPLLKRRAKGVLLTGGAAIVKLDR